jgi:hypothetical protein
MPVWQHLDIFAQSVTAAGVICGGFWTVIRSIKKAWQERDSKLVAMESRIISAFKEHEALDNRRHTENLVHLGEIDVKLGKLWNGNGR